MVSRVLRPVKFAKIAAFVNHNLENRRFPEFIYIYHSELFFVLKITFKKRQKSVIRSLKNLWCHDCMDFCLFVCFSGQSKKHTVVIAAYQPPKSLVMAVAVAVAVAADLG